MTEGILTPMSRRFLALALSVVILGAPVATAVCQATCASSDAADATMGTGAAEHHSCHGEAPTSGTALTASAHPCGHADESPQGRDRGREELAAPAAIVPAATFVAPPVDVSPLVPRRVESSPPSFVSLSAPLRL